MAFHARTIARSTTSLEAEGHGIVLGGLGIACAVLLWMVIGGALPFDFGPYSDASTSAPVMRLADATPAPQVFIR